MRSQIIVTSDFEQTLSNVVSQLQKSFYIFPQNYKEQPDFLIEDAQSVIEEAYMAEENGKYIVIIAANYRLEAQNKLLKLLEEPPVGVDFLLFTKSKSGFLQTIRSRLPISYDAKHKISNDWIHPATNHDFALLLQEAQSWDKSVAKAKLAALLFWYANQQIVHKRLDLFDKSYELINLNARPYIVFANILAHI